MDVKVVKYNLFLPTWDGDMSRVRPIYFMLYLTKF